MEKRPHKKAGKGGVSKQERRRRVAAGLPPVPRLAHAGLPRALYTDLHNLRRPVDRPLTIHGREFLERQIHHLETRKAELEKSVESANDLLEIFPNEHDEYVRVNIIRMLGSISSSLADADQRLAKLRSEAEADAYQLSLQVAFELQELEVRSHERWIGRLDMPEAQREPRRKPTVRSANVPTPLQKNLHQKTIGQFLTKAALNEAAVETPVEKAEGAENAKAESEKADEGKQDQDESDVEEVETFTRCVHQRLHRCGNSQDLALMKKLLKKSCARTCGKKRSSIRHLTLFKPPPHALKANLDYQFSQIENERPTLTQLPTIHLSTNTPQVIISEEDRQKAEDALTLQLGQATLPIVVSDGDSSDSVVQLDGLLNTEQILDLDANHEYLRNIGTAPVCDHDDGAFGSDQEGEGALVLAIPNPTGRTPSLSSWEPPYLYDSVFGEESYCGCVDNPDYRLCQCDQRNDRTTSQ